MQLRFTCRITTYATFRSLATFQVDEVGSNTLRRLKKNLIGTKNIEGGGVFDEGLDSSQIQIKLLISGLYESFKMLENTINLQAKE